MNRALQWKLIAGFLLVFVAGGITGAFVGGSYARRHFFELHHPERIGGRMKERLRAELNLTPEQLEKISPIIDKTTAQLRDIRRDTGQRVRAIIADAHRQMGAELSDEQRQKLKQIEERHQQLATSSLTRFFGGTAVGHPLGRDAALRRPVGAARRPYQCVAFIKGARRFQKKFVRVRRLRHG